MGLVELLIEGGGQEVPPLYWLLLLLTLGCYVTLTQAVKVWLLTKLRI